MNLMARLWARLTSWVHLGDWYDDTFRPWYDRLNPIIGGLCMAVALAAMGYTWVSDRAQDQVTDTLLGCFDTYADNTYSVSKEVRAATEVADGVEVEADEAAAKRDEAFQQVLTFVLSGSKDQAKGLALFTALADANGDLAMKRAELVTARHDLAQTRTDHPPAKPPSKFCVLPK